MEALDPAAGSAAPGGMHAPDPVGSGPSRRLYSAPLVIGVTGHRDLLPSEIPVIRERVRAFFGDLRSVDVHVRHLRQKVEIDPSTPQLIRTVRGVGYAFGGEDARV